jgi:hypothetical protein
MSEIFVFGANEAGRHGKGAALHAKKHYGAVYGQGFGRQGMSFGIPTKDANLKTLPLEKIRDHVSNFLLYANAHPELTFKVSAVGCGLAGYTPYDIAHMFMAAPANVHLPNEFLDELNNITYQVFK